jgi:hypothetical protein
MAEEKIVERQKITINKVEYYLDSLDENSQKILGDIRVIDGEMQRLQVQMSIAGVAKNSLLEKIDEESEGFEQVSEETEETENERREPKGESWEDQ